MHSIVQVKTDKWTQNAHSFYKTGIFLHLTNYIYRKATNGDKSTSEPLSSRNLRQDSLLLLVWSSHVQWSVQQHYFYCCPFPPAAVSALVPARCWVAPAPSPRQEISHQQETCGQLSLHQPAVHRAIQTTFCNPSHLCPTKKNTSNISVHCQWKTNKMPHSS